MRDNRHAEVVGTTPVMVLDGCEERGSRVVSLLQPGDRFDIKRKRARLNTDGPARSVPSSDHFDAGGARLDSQQIESALEAIVLVVMFEG